MDTYTREQIKKDPLMMKLLKLIVSKHKVAQHTIDVLTKDENRGIKGFCEMATHFIFWPGDRPGDPDLYFSYDVETFLKDPEKGFAGMKVTSITLYDGYEEYEPIRLRMLHGTTHSDGVHLN